MSDSFIYHFIFVSLAAVCSFLLIEHEVIMKFQLPTSRYIIEFVHVTRTRMKFNIGPLTGRNYW